MATPEETRIRIKEMRERIFKEGDKDSFENDIKKSTAQPLIPKKEEIPKEDELAIEKAKIVQKNEISAGSKNPVEAVDQSFSDKFQQSDDKISELSANIHEKQPNLLWILKISKEISRQHCLTELKIMKQKIILKLSRWRTF